MACHGPWMEGVMVLTSLPPSRVILRPEVSFRSLRRYSMRSGSAFRRVCTLSRPFTGAEAEAEAEGREEGREPGGGGGRGRGGGGRAERRAIGKRQPKEAAERGSMSIVEMESMRYIEGRRWGPKGGPQQDTKEEPREPMGANEQQRKIRGEWRPCGHVWTCAFASASA